MTAELTNEQIVTNLLVANEFLNSKCEISEPKSSNLGNYLSNPINLKPEFDKFFKYSFSNLNKI